MNFPVCSAIICQSPSSLSVLMFPFPTLFLSSRLGSLCIGHSSKKCSTVSCPFPHSQLGLSVMPKRCRYLLRPQWPVLSCTVLAQVFLLGSLLYSLGPYSLPFFIMMRFRCRPVGFLSVLHAWIHCFVDASLISLIRVYFSDSALWF